MTLFELPPPGDLGNGWSLRFLTAGQMLECRDEGEAMAGEERDKALWANAALLSRVLLKDGEPAYESGEAVLESLTVGQMDSLTRRWWAQDDFSTRSLGEEQATRAEWTAQEGSENEHFDMARFLALGGRLEQPARGFAEAGSGPAGPSVLSGFPALWPQRTLPLQAPAAAQRAYKDYPYMAEGTVLPYSGGAVPEAVPGKAPAEVFLSQQQERAGAEEPFQAEHSVVKVLLPETVRAEPGLTVEELDKTVERDARRYDGGLTLL